MFTIIRIGAHRSIPFYAKSRRTSNKRRRPHVLLFCKSDIQKALLYIELVYSKSCIIFPVLFSSIRKVLYSKNTRLTSGISSIQRIYNTSINTRPRRERCAKLYKSLEKSWRFRRCRAILSSSRTDRGGVCENRSRIRSVRRSGRGWYDSTFWAWKSLRIEIRAFGNPPRNRASAPNK